MTFKEKSRFSDFTKIMDLVVFQFFLLKHFASLLALLTLFSLSAPLITMFSLINVKLLTEELFIFIIEISKVAIFLIPK